MIIIYFIICNIIINIICIISIIYVFLIIFIYMNIFEEILWPQFKQLREIKNLPEREQIKRYNFLHYYRSPLAP